MATDQQLATLYSQLRAAFLSRHFAIGRYFRRNFFSQQNQLNTNLKTSDLLAQSETDQQLTRWNCIRNPPENDNPLLTGSMFLACLAVEDAIGHPHAPRILHSAVATFKSLYKSSGNHFDGYPMRWDPTCSDRWLLAGSSPLASDEFLIENGNYLYCSPSTDPRHWPLRNRDTLVNLMGEQETQRYIKANGTDLGDERWGYFDRYRRWELSMDELVGLVTTYFIINKLCTSAGTRMEVVRQANNLGDYLAEHSWLLVRPVGGLNARGATGILPALEFPLGRALQSITGNSYAARTDFAGAMKQAGYWNCLSDPLTLWTVAGAVAAPVIAPMLTGVIASLGIFAFIPESVPLAGIALPVAGIPASILSVAVPVASVPMARTYAVYQSRGCFDVKDDPAAQEVAISLFLKENIPLATRFQGWIFACGFTGGKTGAWSAAFPPYFALTALDDPDTTVRDAYLGWLAERHKHTNLEPSDHPIAEGCFASAVAVLLGAGATEEARLKSLLDQKFTSLANAFVNDIPVVDGNGVIDEIYPQAIDYQVGLALAWLHAKRRSDAGNPVTTAGFPALPSNILFWPVPAVPANVVQSMQAGQLTLPITAIQDTATPTVFSYGAELFSTENSPQKPDVPAPVFPSTPARMVIDRTVTVHQSDGDVNTGIVLNNGDDYEIFAAGSIWAGDVLHGNNGPDGWNDVQWDSTWPLFGSLDPINAHSNCLLGRLGGYFFIGSSRPRGRFLYSGPCPLWLRINSKNPGSGNGSFQVRVQVWSSLDQSLRKQLAAHSLAVASVGALAQKLGQNWPPPPTLSLRQLELQLSNS
ncbi:hypothetical protein [Alloacidobacterium sp.]|uniref:hypothetical protein n=1 Tax=Alloacidobacterium sp. TaxID=2951999 RepID=UPI002D3EE0EA|nr:hypothetical protein [Alloacidobacterium sp.]HYK34324.1 hypothetical protein [Alloacidobacterium sp.]